MRLAVGLAVLLLAGCVDPGAAPLQDAVAQRELALPFPSCHDLYDICLEPSVGADAHGNVVVANGFGTTLALSRDGGASWTNLEVPAVDIAGVPGATDTDSLVLMTPGGRILFSSIVASYQNGPLGSAGGILLLGLHTGVSDDLGATWTSRFLDLQDQRETLGADRQWLTAAPDGSLYLSYNHFATAPFLGYAGPVDVSTASGGDLLEVARSADGGATWGSFVRASQPGFTGAGQGATTSQGEVLIPVVRGSLTDDATSTQVLRSSDEGRTWTADVVEPARPNGAAWFPAVAVAPDGAEAVAWWSGNGQIQLVTRVAGATQWSAPHALTSSGETAQTGPGLVATGASSFAVTFATGHEDHGQQVGDLLLARVTSGAPPERTVLAANQTWRIRGANADFTTAALLPDGRIASALAVVQQRESHIEVHVG